MPPPGTKPASECCSEQGKRRGGEGRRRRGDGDKKVEVEGVEEKKGKEGRRVQRGLARGIQEKKGGGRREGRGGRGGFICLLFTLPLSDANLIGARGAREFLRRDC